MGGTHSPPLEITYNRSQLRNHWMFIFLAQCPGVKTILMVSCPRFPSSPVKAFIFNRYHPVPSSPIQSHPVPFPTSGHPQGIPKRHPCGIPASKAPVQSGDGLCHFFRRAVSRCAGASTLALAEVEDGPGKSSKNQRILGRCWKMNWMIFFWTLFRSRSLRFGTEPRLGIMDQICPSSDASDLAANNWFQRTWQNHHENPGRPRRFPQKLGCNQPTEGTDEGWEPCHKAMHLHCRTPASKTSTHLVLPTWFMCSCAMYGCKPRNVGMWMTATKGVRIVLIHDQMGSALFLTFLSFRHLLWSCLILCRRSKS